MQSQQIDELAGRAAERIAAGDAAMTEAIRRGQSPPAAPLVEVFAAEVLALAEASGELPDDEAARVQCVARGCRLASGPVVTILAADLALLCARAAASGRAD